MDAPDDADGSPPPVLLDVMCGKLATYLRLCGYDAAYALDRGVEADDRLREIAAAEGRVLITRDRELAARADSADGGPPAVRLTERDVIDQLRELVAAGFPVELAAEPSRCGACNGAVERVAVAGDAGRAPDASAADGVDAGTDAGASAADDRVPPDRPEYVPDDVGASRPGWRCTECGQWFWKGGHWDDVAARLADL